MSFITADQLTRTYGSGDAAVAALSDVGFTVEAGDFVAVMGESGAGKSTLLAVMGAINRPSAGTYTVDGFDVYALDQERRADFRREYLGFVFQSFHLVPYLTVVENVLLPLTTVRMRRKDKAAMAMQAMARVGLASKADRLPNQLSGGEKERVAVARAIVNEPPILLADEPTGNLDSRNSREVMRLLENLNAAGTTIIMVTHSTACADSAGRRLEMSDGRLTRERRRHSVRAA